MAPVAAVTTAAVWVCLWVSTPMTRSAESASMCIALAPCPDADVVGAGPGPELGRTVTGHARLPRAVKLLHQASSSGRAGAGSRGWTSPVQDTPSGSVI